MHMSTFAREGAEGFKPLSGHDGCSPLAFHDALHPWAIAPVAIQFAAPGAGRRPQEALKRPRCNSATDFLLAEDLLAQPSEARAVVKYYDLLDRLQPATAQAICHDNILSLVKRY